MKIKFKLLTSAIILYILLGASSVNVVYADSGDGSVKTVNTLGELESALADESVQEVIVSNQITLLGGTVLDGKGKIVRVAVTGMNEAGIVNSTTTGDKKAPSTYGVFKVTGGTVTIQNMTIRGGGRSAVEVSGSSTLTMENVTVRDTYSSGRAGGGLSLNGTSVVAILKNSSIIRNAAEYGGGIVCDGGKLIMDNCSLSENRSLGGSACGGGAMEIKNGGVLYANNTVIANNTSTEIGGAINCKGSALYLMNCTVTGNATTRESKYGGGIGNNCGKVYAVNSIFLNNYYVDEYGKKTVPSDIAGYASTEVIDLHHCIYGEIVNVDNVTGSGNKYNGDGKDIDYNKADGDGVFPGYQNIGIINAEGSYGEITYPHPALLKRDGSLLYVPVATCNEAATGSVKTYFSCEGSRVYMSFDEDGTNTPLGNLEISDQPVTTYIDGTSRQAGVLGAAKAIEGKIYTVRLKPGENGKVSGTTVYGDSYIEGEMVTVIAEPDGDNEFLGWFDGDSEKCLSDEEEYSFCPSSDIILSAKFGSHTHVWATEWNRDGSYHWHECEAADACCFTINSDKNGYGAHSPGEWQTVTKATCTAGGREERTCSVCKYVETRGIALNPSAHNLSKIEANAPTCTEPGNNGYWTCEDCGKVFKDAEGTTVTTVEEEILSATGHSMTKTEAKAATCTEPGNNAYWTCKTCGKVFKDADGVEETTVVAETFSATGHSMTKTEANAATCTETGNNAYWTCGTCEKVFKDADGVVETTVVAETLSATGPA